ncbi:MAG TPA: tetratricopeptide repeat protein [Pricia sp.]|nr:tetratricopeptide repeat protein [Pricia sp.]
MKFKIAFFLCLLGYLASAQEDDKAKQKALTESKDLTWEGNKQLSEDNFAEAEVDYRKAIAKSDENIAARYNLGNAYYYNETYSEAFGRFKQAGELASDKSEKHVAYHNMGNVFMKRKDYQKAVEAYKEALRSDPTDDETRYNLALAKKMLKKEQQQNDQNKDNKDEKDKKDQKDKSEDKKEGDNENKNTGQDKKEEGDKGDQNEEKKEENKQGEGDQKKEQNKKPEQGDQQEQEQPQRRPNQLSKQQVKNLLEAMQNEEKKVQEKMDAKKVKGAKVRTEKDW